MHQVSTSRIKHCHNENKTICLYKQNRLQSPISKYAAFSGWHQQRAPQKWHFKQKGQFVPPKELSSHTLDSLCQKPKVPGIPYAFHRVVGPEAWHLAGWFGSEFSQLTAQDSCLHFPTARSHEPQKVTLGHNWIATEWLTHTQFLYKLLQWLFYAIYAI